ncbi:hypothetical protein ACHAW5_004619 [Stephanodiscus triporus]|uniref:HPP transmembrane region domain-containing protein n=1 Tax=Stephanodiscus triporus TaxID=2934178 RepID=A0ABD3QU95_9STRA
MRDEGSAVALDAKRHTHSVPALRTGGPRLSEKFESEDLLLSTLKDAGWHAFGVVFIEVWMLSSDGQKISRPSNGHWMDPVFMQSAPDPGLAREANNNALDCAPGESMAGTLFADAGRIWLTKVSQVDWRQIKSMMDDPFVEQGRDKRFEQLYNLGIGIVATVPFRFQRRHGIVMFMSRATADIDILMSEKNEKYLLCAVDLIAASFAIQEARDECVRLKEARRQSVMNKVQRSIRKLDGKGKSIFASTILLISRRPAATSATTVASPTVAYQAPSQLSIKADKRGRVLAFATELTRSLKKSLLKWRGAGLEAPPRQKMKESLIALVGVFCAMLALVSNPLHSNIPNDYEYNYMAGWFASTLCIVFSLTAAPVGQPIQIVLSHFWNCLVGLAFQSSALPLIMKQSMSTAFGVAGMAYLGIMHPPAASLSFLFSTTSSSDPITVLWILTGDAILISIGVVYLNMFEEKQYPTYWTGRSWMRKQLARRMPDGGAWGCGCKAKPTATGESEPPRRSSTQDERV